MVSKLLRLTHTLLPLKLVQHWGLFYYRVVRRVIPFTVPAVKAAKLDTQQAVFHRYQPVSWLGGYRFEFLNTTADVAPDTWLADGKSLLWHYNLQYFDHLNAVDSAHGPQAQAGLVLDWWQFHQPKQGVAWDPYPTSLRAVNLCKWGWEQDNLLKWVPKEEWLALLDRHYQEVKRKLEFQIQANHLFANLKALWFLQATLPEYREKHGSWLCKKMIGELALQFDQQGGHFELSPMYHRIMLWDLLDMLAVGRNVTEFCSVVAQIEQVASKALGWAVALSHPDEEVAFFNDGSIGIAPSLSRLMDYATSLNVNAERYEAGDISGYVVQTIGVAKLFCDVAEVGPAIQPGHVHADTLSFELSLGQQRIIVNSGTSEYGLSDERLRQRSTAAHSTVVVDGKNSSDVWSGFRVGRKAKIIEKTVSLGDECSEIEAAHDGYKPLLHRRKWRFSEGCLMVHDEVNGIAGKKSYFYLHPLVKISQVTSSQFSLQWPEGQARLNVLSKVDSAAIEVSTWHPGFGVVVANKCLVLTWAADSCSIKLNW